MSNLRYLCLLAHSRVIFVICLRPVSCVPNVVSFFGLSIFLLLLRCSITFNYLNISETLDKRRSITYSHGSIL